MTVNPFTLGDNKVNGRLELQGDGAGWLQIRTELHGSVTVIDIDGADWPAVALAGMRQLGHEVTTQTVDAEAHRVNQVMRNLEKMARAADEKRSEEARNRRRDDLAAEFAREVFGKDALNHTYADTAWTTQRAIDHIIALEAERS